MKMKPVQGWMIVDKNGKSISKFLSTSLTLMLEFETYKGILPKGQFRVAKVEIRETGSGSAGRGS